MKKNLIYIIYVLILLLSILYISFSYFFEKEKSYLILDSNNVWELSKDEIKKTSSKKLKKLNYSNIKLYGSDSNMKGYIDSETDYIYNEHYELITREPQMYILAGTKELKNYTNTITFTLTKEDYEIVENVLTYNNLSFDLETTYTKKSKLDNNTYLYSVYTRAQSNYNYSIIFTYRNEHADVLYVKNFNEDTNEGRKSILYGIIDINNDSKKEIILLSDLLGSAGNECYSLYEYDIESKKYGPTIDCEEE